MTNFLRKLWPMAVAAAVVVSVGALSVGVASASPPHQGGAKSSKKPPRHRHKHAIKGDPGPRGPRGATGAAGPAGPAGPAGAPGVGTQFQFALRTNSQTAPVLELNGVRIEAGCINGALELVVRPQGGDHNIVEVTAFDNSTAEFWTISEPEAPINKPINMLGGGSPFDDYNGLLAVRTFSGLMTTIQWWAMGSNNTSQGDCVGGGTATP